MTWTTMVASEGPPRNTLQPTSFPLHAGPYTLHTTPYTIHPTSFTLHPTTFTRFPARYTLHATPCTLHKGFRGGCYNDVEDHGSLGGPSRERGAVALDGLPFPSR